MIITCTCGAKLKVSDDKLTEAGVRIKCPKCGTAHLARSPAPADARPFTEPAMPWFAPAAGVAPRAAPVSVQRTAPAPSSSLVLVAHDSKLVAEMIQGVVKEAGLTVEHATDGLDALKKATALKPKVMIVDVGLTGIYGFELCERLKGDPETRSIKIILLSSVYGLTAYKRNPVTLYGADDYIEKHDIPDRLVPKLKQLLSGRPAVAPDSPADPASAAGKTPPAPEKGTGPSAVSAAKPSLQAPDAEFAAPEVPDIMPRVPVTLDTSRKRASSQVSLPPVAPTPKAEEQRIPPMPAAPAPVAKTEPLKPVVMRPAMQDGSIDLDASFFEQDEYVAPVKAPLKAAVDPEEVEKARRFARLIVSDIVLYNQEAVAEGLTRGTFYDLLKDDIIEGRSLYEKRVPEVIRQSKDYFQEAFDNFIAAKKKQR